MVEHGWHGLHGASKIVSSARYISVPLALT
jgi:hypothetical protein